MQGTTHKCGGVALGAIASLAISKYTGVNVVETAMILTGASFGALLPDIDHKGSEIGRKLKPVASIVCKHTEHRGFTHTTLCAFIVSMVALALSSLLQATYSGTLTYRIVFGCILGFSAWVVFDTLLNSMRPKFVHNYTIRKILDLELPSLIVLCIFCIVFANALMATLYMFAWGISIGYFSHLLLDLFNPTGVPVLYPYSKQRFSVAKIRTGSHEHAVTFVCNGITIISIVTMVAL